MIAVALFEVRCRWVDPAKPRARKVLEMTFVVAASSRDEALELAKAEERTSLCERWVVTPVDGHVYALPSRMVAR